MNKKKGDLVIEYEILSPTLEYMDLPLVTYDFINEEIENGFLFRGGLRGLTGMFFSLSILSIQMSLAIESLRAVGLLLDEPSKVIILDDYDFGDEK